MSSIRRRSGWRACNTLSRRSPVRISISFFFFQAEDGIRDKLVTGVQTCALPISCGPPGGVGGAGGLATRGSGVLDFCGVVESDGAIHLEPEVSLFLGEGHPIP